MVVVRVFGGPHLSEEAGHALRDPLAEEELGGLVALATQVIHLDGDLGCRSRPRGE